MDLADGIMFRVSQLPSQAQEPRWPSRNICCPKPLCVLLWHLCAGRGSISIHNLAAIKQNWMYFGKYIHSQALLGPKTFLPSSEPLPAWSANHSSRTLQKVIITDFESQICKKGQKPAPGRFLPMHL